MAEAPAPQNAPALTLDRAISTATEAVGRFRDDLGRSNDALYSALEHIAHVEQAAAAEPDRFEAALRERGLKATAASRRNPFTLPLRLLFGSSLDRPTVSRYAAALAHAREALGGDAGQQGAVKGYFASAGGVEAVLREARAKRHADKDESTDDELDPASIPAQGEWRPQGTVGEPGHLILLVGRCRDDGAVDVVGIDRENERKLKKRLARLVVRSSEDDAQSLQSLIPGDSQPEQAPLPLTEALKKALSFLSVAPRGSEKPVHLLASDAVAGITAEAAPISVKGLSRKRKKNWASEEPVRLAVEMPCPSRLQGQFDLLPLIKVTGKGYSLIGGNAGKRATWEKFGLQLDLTGGQAKGATYRTKRTSPTSSVQSEATPTEVALSASNLELLSMFREGLEQAVEANQSLLLGVPREEVAARHPAIAACLPPQEHVARLVTVATAAGGNHLPHHEADQKGNIRLLEKRSYVEEAVAVNVFFDPDGAEFTVPSRDLFRVSMKGGMACFEDPVKLRTFACRTLGDHHSGRVVYLPLKVVADIAGFLADEVAAEVSLHFFKEQVKIEGTAKGLKFRATVPAIPADVAEAAPFRTNIKKFGAVNSISPIRWLGNKTVYLSVIEKWLPRQITEYREPFVGGGSVFFHVRRYYSGRNVDYWINDADRAVACYWKAIRDEPKALLEGIQHIAHQYRGRPDQAKPQFARMIDTMRDDANSDLECAIQFAVANHWCFNGLMTKRTGFSPAAHKRKLDTSEARIWEAHELLQDVKITHEDYSTMLRARGSGVLIMLDPVYDDRTEAEARQDMANEEAATSTMNSVLYHAKMDFHRFYHELAETEHSWMLTHSRGTGFDYEMLHLSLKLWDGLNRQAYPAVTGTHPNGAPRHEVLFTNYDPKGDYWALLEKMEEHDARMLNERYALGNREEYERAISELSDA
ncbi:DNA adenine methylase [Caenispirillum salinarum]|uniref:DNA adenine methylase n=1 Tax=Caenispirillum salinarum TaxID=859058 RepID=UPI00384D0CA3